MNEVAFTLGVANKKTSQNKLEGLTTPSIPMYST